MDKKIIVVIALCMAVATQTFAQQDEKRSIENDRQPRGEKNRPELSETLTDKQEAQVKAILSK